MKLYSIHEARYATGICYGYYYKSLFNSNRSPIMDDKVMVIKLAERHQKILLAIYPELARIKEDE